MAKVTLKNTRQGDVTLNGVTIVANGTAEFDDSIVAEMRKHKVIRNWFDNGYLVEQAATPTPLPTPPDGGDPKALASANKGADSKPKKN